MQWEEIDVEKVAQDLELLAKQKSGFDSHALAEKFEVVLDLEVVAEVAGDLENLRAARLAALRSVLRNCVDRIALSETRTAASIYFFLLSPDELFDLGLSDSLLKSTLTQRREAIAHLRNDTASAFRNGDEHRMCPLVAGELLRYEVETRKRPPLPPVDEHERDAGLDAMTTRSATQAVSRAISSFYHEDQHLLALASLLIPDRPIYYDAALQLAMSDGARKDEYEYRLSFSFTAEMQEYVVGYVARSPLTDALLVGAKGVTDVYSFSTPAGRDECYDKVNGSLDVVTLITSLSDGRTRHQPARLEPVPEDEYGHYLATELDQHSDSVKLLRARLPQPQSGSHSRVNISQHFTERKSDHFCYWVADRPIFLRHVRVDVRDFTPPASERERRVTFQPFMMTTNKDLSLDRDNVIDVETANWLIRGQGFVVVW